MKTTYLSLLKKLALATLLTFGYVAHAQDASNLPLYPVVPDNLNLPEGSAELLKSRLDQAITANGMGGMASLTNRFVVVPKIVVLQKSITATAPAMTQLSLEAILKVADLGSKRTLGTVTIPLNGVGATEEKAYTMAFQNMPYSDGPVVDFMKQSREKILAFYTTNCDRIIAQANTSIARNEPEEALEQLLSVPFEAKTCFTKANNLVPKAFRAWQLKQCDVFMQKASAALAAGKEEEAAQALAMVPSYSVCGKRADAMVKKLNQQWLMKYQNEFKLRQQKVEAAKWVAAALLESARRFYPIYVWPGTVTQPNASQLDWLK